MTHHELSLSWRHQPPQRWWLPATPAQYPGRPGGAESRHQGLCWSSSTGTASRWTTGKDLNTQAYIGHKSSVQASLKQAYTGNLSKAQTSMEEAECVVWCDMCVHAGFHRDMCIKEQLLSTQSRCYALTHKLGPSFSLDSSGAAVPDAYKDFLETGHQLLAKRSWVHLQTVGQSRPK